MCADKRKLSLAHCLPDLFRVVAKEAGGLDLTVAKQRDLFERSKVIFGEHLAHGV